ncbi:MAG: chloride channel protein [Desulfobacterales bacterium]|jgi:CIC family chloride channel protein|nr:chloride channel protein [Desulfobacterales bacterium]
MDRSFINFLNKWRYPASWAIFRFDDRILMILLAVIVGTCAGLAAVALNRSLLFLFEQLNHLRHFWWGFILPAIGAVLSTIVLENIFKESAGYGVPEVIYSVSRFGGLLRLRSSFSRLISSCLTIGSGGSAGPEAPVVISGSAIGSNIATLFSLNDRQRITLVGCGTAAAIGSIFNAPIAGMVFAIEVILGDWKAPSIIPIAIASVAGTELSRLLQGNQIAFSHRVFHLDMIENLSCFGLGIFCAAASILLTRALGIMHHRAEKVQLPSWLKAAVGGCAVGLIGIFMPPVLGEGYHSIRSMIIGAFEPGLMFAAIAVGAKIAATSLTLGSGGSGGIFAPGLVIGSMVGLTYHRALTFLWPSAEWVNEGSFALLGMAGLISGILQAPLTGIFLIIEITGGYDVILPLIIVSAISTSLCHYIEPASIYLKGLIEKGQLLRLGTDARVLQDLSITELIEKDCTVVTPNLLLRDFIKIIERSHRNYFPVQEEDTGLFVGLIHLDDIRPYLFNRGMYDVVLLGQIMRTEVEVINPNDDLPNVLNIMDEKRYFSMPVVKNGRFIGMISKATLLDQYRKELRIQTIV